MMRGIRRLVICAAATGLLVGGAVTAGLEVAHADGTVTTCIGAGDTAVHYQCTLTGTVASPSSITVTVTDDVANAKEDVTVDVTTLTCTDNTGSASEPESKTTGATSLTDNIVPLPATADGQCNVSATVSLPSSDFVTGFVPGEFSATLSYKSATSASPSPTPSPIGTGPQPVHPVKGFGGKCVDDKGNSSANRTAVVIWSCSATDQAENWRLSGGELIHNGKCLNDKGSGGSGSPVILYTCNGGSNEKWAELANGELKLQAHGGTLCLDDPRSSTKNGTQLIVYRCKDSANQKWSLP